MAFISVGRFRGKPPDLILKGPPVAAASRRHVVTAGGSSSPCDDGGDGSFTRNLMSAALSINAAEILGSWVALASPNKIAA